MHVILISHTPRSLKRTLCSLSAAQIWGCVLIFVNMAMLWIAPTDVPLLALRGHQLPPIYFDEGLWWCLLRGVLCLGQFFGVVVYVPPRLQPCYRPIRRAYTPPAQALQPLHHRFAAPHVFQPWPSTPELLPPPTRLLHLSTSTRARLSSTIVIPFFFI